jgi:hypothetical protein
MESGCLTKTVDSCNGYGVHCAWLDLVAKTAILDLLVHSWSQQNWLRCAGILHPHSSEEASLPTAALSGHHARKHSCKLVRRTYELERVVWEMS